MRPRRPGQHRFWKMSLLGLVALLLGDMTVTQIVRAASEEAWDALVKEAGAACQIASELENPRVVWSNPAYERQAALIVVGKWPQSHMNGDQGYMLCLFDKESAKVEIQEIEPTLFR